MNKVLEQQLYNELYSLYENTREFWVINPIFHDFSVSNDSILFLPKLKKALLESKVNVNNLIIYLGNTEQNGYERLFFLNDLWNLVRKDFES